MATIYRGYNIAPHANGGFYWTDERGNPHFADLAPASNSAVGFKTEEQAMDAIDQYRRNMAKA